MKWLNSLFLTIMVVNLTACNSKEKIEDITIKPYSVTLEKGEDMKNSLWGDKPSYKLKIKATWAEIEVMVNGVSVYKHFEYNSCYREHPINDYITTGENEIKVLIITDESSNYQIKERAKVSVSLLVRSSETGKEYTVSTLDYDNTKKDKLAQSSEAKEYEITYIGPSNSEKVVVSKVKSRALTRYQADRVGGVELSQKVTLRTPFPRWKFLDSEEIINKSFNDLIKSGEAIKFKDSKEIQELYAIYGKIHTAIKEGKISSIIDMFDERGAEMDRAYYHESGYNKEEMLKDLIEASNEWEIREFDPKKADYFIENNRKLIYLKVIRFKNSNGLFMTLGMKFRRENGKWILTR